MFAVPGWAVSADSLVSEQGSGRADQQRSGKEPTGVAKKRKHAHPDQDQSRKLSGTELEKLWRARFETKIAHQRTSARQENRHGHKKSKESLKEKDHGATTTKPASDYELEKQPRLDDDSGHGFGSEQRGAASASADAAARPRKKDTHTKFKHEEIKSTTSKPLSQGLSPQAGPPPATVLTPLQAKMRSKLTSARFRHLNETLYTTSSSAAMELFTSSPDLFAEYHAGFSQQVKESWPQNPVDTYIDAIKKRGHISPSDHAAGKTLLPLPRRKTGRCTIADLGCGDAPLARGCQSQMKALQLKFHNFDLHAPNSLVTKADISNLPLRDGEADVVVFCLSLMGTNWMDFVEEAWRVLRGDGRGEVWVAEVKSRFGRVTKGRVVENSVGKRKKNKSESKNPKSQRDDDTDGDGDGREIFAEDARSPSEQPSDDMDISAFVTVFQRRGFVLREGSVDKGNKMFVSMIFVKSGVPTVGKHQGLKWNGHKYERRPEGKMRHVNRAEAGEEISPEEEAKVLKPCVYKTR